MSPPCRGRVYLLPCVVRTDTRDGGEVREMCMTYMYINNMYLTFSCFPFSALVWFTAYARLFLPPSGRRFIFLFLSLVALFYFLHLLPSRNTNRKSATQTPTPDPRSLFPFLRSPHKPPDPVSVFPANPGLWEFLSMTMPHALRPTEMYQRAHPSAVSQQTTKKKTKHKQQNTPTFPHA